MGNARAYSGQRWQLAAKKKEMHVLTAGRGGSYIEMSVEPSSKALEISVASPEPGRTGSQFYRSDSRDGTAALNLQE